MKNKLTPRMEMFCQRYFEIGKATEAALIAGYSPKSAACIASQNLTKPAIIEYLKELRQKAEDASVADVLERKQRLTGIIRASIPDFQDEGGGIRVKKGLAMVGAVSEVTTRHKMSRKASEPVVITNLKLHSPIQAIDLLNKMDKIYADGQVGNTLIINIDKAVVNASKRLEDIINRLALRSGEGGVS